MASNNILRRPSEWIGSVFAGLLCCGIGIVSAEIRVLKPTDMLAFAGALVGAGASVLGAFAVADRQRANDRDGARKLLRDVATGIHDDMTFLLDLQRATINPERKELFSETGEPDYDAVARKVDQIALGVPETAEYLPTADLGARSGSISVLAVELRLRAALKIAQPPFARWDKSRRSFRVTAGVLEDVTIHIMPADLLELRDACATALRGL